MLRKASLYAFLSVCLLMSCAEGKESPEPLFEGIFILNGGNWGGNDSNIGIYDPVTKKFSPDAFLGVNGQKLGELGQDMAVCNGELYIAVYGSKVIFVTDMSLRIKDMITAEHDGVTLSPRSLYAAASKVYVTYYEGYAGEINAADRSVRLTAVGPNPEGIAVSGDRLYTADSGGMSYPDYGDKVSVVSLDPFEKSGDITVSLNPASIAVSSDGGRLYVLCYGNYDDVPASVECIDLMTGNAMREEYLSAMAMAAGKNDMLYILAGGKLYMHDMASDSCEGEFVSDGTSLAGAYSLSVTSEGYVYVGISDYINTGDMLVFRPDGRLHDAFDTSGLNPLKAL